jgi:hypothetical protein
MDEVEQRVQGTLQRPTVNVSALDVDAMLAGVARGVRLRRLRRAVAVAAAVVLAVVGAAASLNPFCRQTRGPRRRPPDYLKAKGSRRSTWAWVVRVVWLPETMASG